MKTEETLYIKILTWAYQKQEKGFHWEELKNKFNLTSEQNEWALKLFRSNMPASDNLVDHLSYNTKRDEHLFVITAKGTSEAIGYLNLKEAEKISKWAIGIALSTIFINIVVGILQIHLK